MNAFSWDYAQGRPALAVLVIGSTVTASCSFGSRTTAERETFQTSFEQQALDLLRVALHSTAEALGYANLSPAQIVIQSDFQPQHSEALREHGLTTAMMARTLASSLGYATRPKDEVIVCQHGPQRPILHPCRMTFDGVYYSPVITRFSGDLATVAIHFMARRGNAGGTRVIEMLRTAGRWKVVNVSNITS